MDEIKEKLYQQLEIDYCCPVSEMRDRENHFTEYKLLDGLKQPIFLADWNQCE